MLRMVQNNHAAAAKRYFDDGLAREDYYTPRVKKDAEREEPSRWGGKGAELLGLKGTVDREGFHRLCENRTPDGEASLTPRTKANRRVGYDINFHCPKSVSILYALTGDRAILESFRAAVRETMEHLEADAKARVRAGGGQGDRVTGNLIWAEFIHTTARPIGGIPDPHLHAHCFTFNATFDPIERKWKAGEFGDIKSNASFHEAAFHAQFAGRLSEHGYRVERRGRFWEVVEVPGSAIEKFSRRTAEINQVAAKRGIVDPKEKAELGARTRKSKAETFPWAEIQRDWRERLTADEAARVHAAKNGRVPPSGGDVARGVFLHALETCLDRSSVVSERTLLEHALRHGVGRVNLPALQDELSRSDLIRKDVNGERLFTTAAVLEQEKRMLAFAREGRGTCPALCRDAGGVKEPGLSDEQRTAVLRVFGSRDRVTLLRGAGRSLVSKAAIEAIEATGQAVVKLTPAAATRTEHELPSFLSTPSLQERARRGVVWLDDAHAAGARSLSSLFDAAKALDARIVLSGGRRRQATGERSDMLRLLETQAGLRSAEIQRVRRDHAEHRSAAQALGGGKTAAGFEKLDRLGAIREVKPAELPAAVAAEYARATKQKKTAQVVASKDSDRITDAIREKLRGLKLLGRSRGFERLTSLGLSDEQRSDAAVYERGQVVVFYKSAKGFKAGHRYEVMGRDAFGNVLARHLANSTSLLPSKLPWVEALPLSKSDRFEVFNQSSIELAKGDSIRVTRSGRTKNERFGPEKLLSKRGQAIRRANFKMFGVKVPDRHYRVQKDALHRVVGFTLAGDIKLENGWVLPKNFGHLEHGYCVASQTTRGRSVERLLIAHAGDSKSEFRVPKGRGVESVTVFTDDKNALRSTMAKDASTPAAERPRASTVQSERPMGRQERERER